MTCVTRPSARPRGFEPVRFSPRTAIASQKQGANKRVCLPMTFMVNGNWGAPHYGRPLPPSVYARGQKKSAPSRPRHLGRNTCANELGGGGQIFGSQTCDKHEPYAGFVRKCAQMSPSCGRPFRRLIRAPRRVGGAKFAWGGAVWLHGGLLGGRGDMKCSPAGSLGPASFLLLNVSSQGPT